MRVRSYLSRLIHQHIQYNSVKREDHCYIFTFSLLFVFPSSLFSVERGHILRTCEIPSLHPTESMAPMMKTTITLLYTPLYSSRLVSSLLLSSPPFSSPVSCCLFFFSSTAPPHTHIWPARSGVLSPPIGAGAIAHPRRPRGTRDKRANLHGDKARTNINGEIYI